MEKQTSRAMVEQCQPLEHSFIPINVTRTKKQVQIFMLCQKCGIVAQSVSAHAPSWIEPK